MKQFRSSDDSLVVARSNDEAGRCSRRADAPNGQPVTDRFVANRGIWVRFDESRWAMLDPIADERPRGESDANQDDSSREESQEAYQAPAQRFHAQYDVAAFHDSARLRPNSLTGAVTR